MPEIVAAKVTHIVFESFMVNDYPKPGQVTIFNVDTEVKDKAILDRFKNYIKRELVEAKGVKIKVIETEEKPETPKPDADKGTQTNDTGSVDSKPPGEAKPAKDKPKKTQH